MITFIHIADVHIGMGFAHASFGSRYGQLRRKEIKETFYGVLDQCERDAIDILLIAGDFLEEKDISLADLLEINQQMMKLSVTKVLICAGNHDPLSKKNSAYRKIQWCEQVYLFPDEPTLKTLTLGDESVSVHSFSWTTKTRGPLDTEALMLDDEVDYNILMLHGDNNPSGSDYMSIDFKAIAALPYDYVALGHIHTPTILSDKMIYPGCLEPLDFSDQGPRGYVKGKLSNGSMTADWQPISKRQFHVVTCHIKDDMLGEDVYQTLMKALEHIPSKDYVRVIIKGPRHEHLYVDLNQWTRRLMDNRDYVELVDQTVTRIDLEALRTTYENTMIEAYIASFDQEDMSDPVMKEACYEGVRLLLEMVT